MTRGTILLVGPGKREYDLFLARLEKDGFTVAHKTNLIQTLKWLKDEWPQAVLFTAECPPKTVTNLMQQRQFQKRKLPFIVVGQDDVPESLTKITGIAEVFRLHTLAVSHALRRLILGIQLCQIRREDYQ